MNRWGVAAIAPSAFLFAANGVRADELDRVRQMLDVIDAYVEARSLGQGLPRLASRPRQGARGAAGRIRAQRTQFSCARISLQQDSRRERTLTRNSSRRGLLGGGLPVRPGRRDRERLDDASVHAAAPLSDLDRRQPPLGELDELSGVNLNTAFGVPAAAQIVSNFANPRRST